MKRKEDEKITRQELEFIYETTFYIRYYIRRNFYKKVVWEYEKVILMVMSYKLSQMMKGDIKVSLKRKDEC